MPRIAALGAVHHVISRFVDRSWQLAGEDERDAYLVRLGYALARTDWVLLGYALMSSHVHLVLEAGSGSLGGWAKSVPSRMARLLNARHDRLGPVRIRLGPGRPGTGRPGTDYVISFSPGDTEMT